MSIFYLVSTQTHDYSIIGYIIDNHLLNIYDYFINIFGSGGPSASEGFSGGGAGGAGGGPGGPGPSGLETTALISAGLGQLNLDSNSSIGNSTNINYNNTTPSGPGPSGLETTALISGLGQLNLDSNSSIGNSTNTNYNNTTTELGWLEVQSNPTVTSAPGSAAVTEFNNNFTDANPSDTRPMTPPNHQTGSSLAEDSSHIFSSLSNGRLRGQQVVRQGYIFKPIRKRAHEPKEVKQILKVIKKLELAKPQNGVLIALKKHVREQMRVRGVLEPQEVRQINKFLKKLERAIL